MFPVYIFYFRFVRFELFILGNYEASNRLLFGRSDDAEYDAVHNERNLLLEPFVE